MMKDDELIRITDRNISEVVVEKYNLQKAYNYYNGIRDSEQFRYLEENYGLGQPTAIKFIPLLKKHVDALVGEYIGIPIIPKVSCKDSETISKITREKEISISTDIYSFLKKHLNNALLGIISGQGNTTDSSIQKELDKLVQDLNETFISQYEIAAQNVLDYVMQSRNTDVLTKLRILFIDLLVTGYCFYRVKQSPDKNNVTIEALDVLNTFVDRNKNSVYIKDSYRSVVRKWMNKSEIINTYRNELTSEDIKKIKDKFETQSFNNYFYVRSAVNQATGMPTSNGLDSGREITPSFPFDNLAYTKNLIPVYECEWLEVDEDEVMQRYETVRIGQEIYILRGKSENVIRSKDNSSYCSLSVNGVYFLNRSNEPYSLVTACMDLQD